MADEAHSGGPSDANDQSRIDKTSTEAQVPNGPSDAPDTAKPKPAYRQPKLLVYVLLGGLAGAAGREGLTRLIPHATEGMPWPVFLANMSGAFLLGLLLTALAARGPETPRRRDFRLFAGTGLLGGFTTYSSLATDSARLLQTQPWLGAAYALGTVMLGLAAAGLGVWFGGKFGAAEALIELEAELEEETHGEAAAPERTDDPA